MSKYTQNSKNKWEYPASRSSIWSERQLWENADRPESDYRDSKMSCVSFCISLLSPVWDGGNRSLLTSSTRKPCTPSLCETNLNFPGAPKRSEVDVSLVRWRDASLRHEWNGKTPQRTLWKLLGRDENFTTVMSVIPSPLCGKTVHGSQFQFLQAVKWQLVPLSVSPVAFPLRSNPNKTASITWRQQTRDDNQRWHELLEVCGEC